MAIEAPAPALHLVLRRSVGPLPHVVRFARQHPLGGVSALLTVLLVLTAVFAPLLAPYDPEKIIRGARLVRPDGRFLLGTDELGRDVLSRMIYGARISLEVGLVSVAVSTTLGSIFGVVSGYFGGATDLVIQRFMDMVMAFPALVLALAIISVLGPDIVNVMLAIALVATPATSRVVRGATMSVRENAFVEAAMAAGCSHPRIILRHILPNVMAPIIVVATVSIGTAILTEAALSFLGLGTPPPAPSWGNMINGSSRTYLMLAPWIAIFPGVAITVAVLAFNLLGDALRDVLDPRLHGAG